MPLFCLSIGLTQGEIGIKEVICSIVYLVVNIPTGWMADRLSRRVCNFIGDTFIGAALVILGLSTSFTGATVAGIVMAFGRACTEGANEALIKAHCDKLGKNYIDTRKCLSLVTSWVSPGYYLLGGILTVLYSMKVAVLIASIPFFVAAIISCFVEELGAHKEVVCARSLSFKARFSSEYKEMAKAIRFALREDRRLSWFLIAFAVAAVMGGPLMGLIGPMIIAAGGTEGVAATSHVAISAASICGAWLSRNVFKAWRPSRLFLVLSIASLLIMTTTSIHFTLWTVGLHIIVVQMVRIWIGYTLQPLIHEAAPNNIQATVGSLANSALRMLYIVAVLPVNFAAAQGVQWGIVVNALLFIPLVAIVAWGLAKTS